MFSYQSLDLSGTGCVCSVLNFFLVVVPSNVLRCPTKLITMEKHCPADLTVYFVAGGPAAHKLDQDVQSNMK